MTYIIYAILKLTNNIINVTYLQNALFDIVDLKLIVSRQ